MTGVTVARMSEVDERLHGQVARVFVEAYAQDLAALCADQDRWASALDGCFAPDVFYVAVEDGKILGIAAASHGARRAIRLDGAALRRHLGVLRGAVAHLVLRRTFHRTLPYPETTGYVECVATTPSARGRGVATALMRHIEGLPFEELVLEVTDANAGAHRLYAHLGYQEFARKRARFPRLAGYREAISMRKR
ncbi:GNAT family N-acetyltransferase [Xylanimonas ulmi]|uniref:Acetyltransferase (GNAT) family protein n=1 Tax=Xylanimonas ulmi TaxID=228973 RepID=A0A4Q7M3H7_9MICO|nr:GNAT family N-acetyltransferase [Xylanibacterium ulmi]RZS61182.1 acetyltransferase (GNAT) family protein [Xylanibacterium ulmi]